MVVLMFDDEVKDKVDLLVVFGMFDVELKFEFEV